MVTDSFFVFVFFHAKSGEEQKKRSSRSQAVVRAKTSQNFRVSMFGHIITVHNAEKEDICAFCPRRTIHFLFKRRTCLPKRGRMVSLL